MIFNLNSSIEQKYYALCCVFLLLLSIAACSEVKPTLIASSSVNLSDTALVSADLGDDGTLSVMLDVNHRLSVWNNTNKTLLREWQASDFVEKPYYVSLANNKQRIAVAGKHHIAILSVDSGVVIASWRVRGFDEHAKVSQILLSHLGDKVFIGLNEGSIVVVDIKREQRSLFNVHDTTVNQLILTNNQQSILSASFDGKAAQWLVSTGEIIWQSQQRHRVTSLAFGEFNDRIFVSDALDSQQIFDVNKSSNIASLKYFQRNRFFRKALFINKDSKLVTSSSKYQLSLWDVNSGVELKTGNIRAYNFGSTVLDFARNSQGTVLSLSSDGVLEQWQSKQFR